MECKTIKIRIKDSGVKKVLKSMSRAVNVVWNYCNETSFEAIRRDHRHLTGFELQKLAAGSSKELGLGSHTIDEVCEEYVLKRRQFKKKKLRWRSERSLGWVPFKKNGIRFRDGKIEYLKHTFQVFQEERIPNMGTYGAGEFCEDARGRWYICISVKYEKKEHCGTGSVGVDLGLKDVATLSNGNKVLNGKYYRMMENKLARAQKHKKKKQAKGIHAKIKNKRMDALHKASSLIVKQNSLIVIGKFTAKKLTKTRLAKSVHDAGTTIFKTMLKYKASAHQHCICVEVPENFTTQICSACGVIPDSAPKGVKDLEVREWVCSNCETVHDRDTNAALNILRLGHQTLAPKVA